jgi:hypothetical protein
MPVFQGSGTYFEQPEAYDIPCKIISWYFVCTGADSETSLIMYNTDTTEDIAVWFKKIIAGTTEFSSVPFIMLPGYKIIIQSANPINYYISIE